MKAMAGGALMSSISKYGADSEQAMNYAAIMLQSAWRGKQARTEMRAQKNASTLIKVCVCACARLI